MCRIQGRRLTNSWYLAPVQVARCATLAFARANADAEADDMDDADDDVGNRIALAGQWKAERREDQTEDGQATVQDNGFSHVLSHSAG